MIMKTSPKGRSFIKSLEQCRLKAYPVPGTGGVFWAIGWAHTGLEVKPGMVWRQEKADQVFNEDLEMTELNVNSLVRVSLKQNEFDALVSLAFNIRSDSYAGIKTVSLEDCMLLKKLNSGAYRAAADEFLKWDYDRIYKIPELKRRRILEQALFLS